MKKSYLLNEFGDNIMEILEKMRFKKISRTLEKIYGKGTIRNIRNRLHNGFIFCIEGEMIFTKGGKYFRCDQHHVVLVPKASNYDIFVEDGAHCFILDFELCSGVFNKMYEFTIQETESFYKDFQRIQKCPLTLTSHDLISLSIIYDMISCINDYGQNKKYYKVIEEAEIYLKENIFDHALTIGDIARASNISEVYFRKLFKEKYGVSPLHYITDIRIKKAKTMLISDLDLSISNISVSCGFVDIYSFSRVFKKIVGISPLNFKKNMQYRNC